MNRLYDHGRNAFALGRVSWRLDGSVIRAVLVRGAGYVPDVAAHRFLADIPPEARSGDFGLPDRKFCPMLTLHTPVAGVCSADSVVFRDVPAGPPFDYLVLFRDSQLDQTSDLLVIVETAMGLPVTPNGADVFVAWPEDDPNGIFKL